MTSSYISVEIFYICNDKFSVFEWFVLKYMDKSLHYIFSCISVFKFLSGNFYILIVDNFNTIVKECNSKRTAVSRHCFISNI